MRFRPLILLALLPLLHAHAAEAKASDAQKFLGTFGHWQAFTFQEHGQPVCYMSLTFPPLKVKKTSYGGGRLDITQRPGDNSRDVISYTAGYTFKSGSNATLLFGKDSYDLFTVKNTAWARDALTDRIVAKALRTHTTLTIVGQPARHGNASVREAVNLSGAAYAYNAINKACGLATEPLPQPAHPHKNTGKPHRK